MIILTVLKIIFIILLAIIGFILVLTILPVSLKLSYIGEEKNYEIKYAFFTVMSSNEKKGLINRLKKLKGKKHEAKFSPKPIPKTEPIPEHTDKPEKVKESEVSLPESNKKEYSSPPPPEAHRKSPDFPEQKSTEKSRFEKLPEMWEKIMQIWEAASSPVKRLCKGIHFDRIYIDFRISNPDAYDCALNYGKTCTALYNILGVLNQMFSLKKKSINVECIFNKEKSIYDISFTLRFHPVVCLGCGISFLWTYYFKIYKNKSGGKIDGKQRSKKGKADK